MVNESPKTVRRVIFIDRDGVINVDPIGDYIKSWDQFQFEAGALAALKKISDLGYDIILISNQAGIGDGVYPESALWEIHDKMLAEFKRRGIRVHSSFFCLHGKEAGCGCRKPKTGLFEQAAQTIHFERAKTFFIGDKATDVEAGKKFGLKTIMVRTGHGRLDEPKLGSALKPDHIVDALDNAVPLLKT